MSIGLSTDIYCDGTEVLHDVNCTDSYNATGNATEVRALAREDGWRTLKGGRDLCSLCAVEHLQRQREAGAKKAAQTRAQKRGATKLLDGLFKEEKGEQQDG